MWKTLASITSSRNLLSRRAREKTDQVRRVDRKKILMLFGLLLLFNHMLCWLLWFNFLDLLLKYMFKKTLYIIVVCVENRLLFINVDNVNTVVWGVVFMLIFLWKHNALKWKGANKWRHPRWWRTRLRSVCLCVCLGMCYYVWWFIFFLKLTVNVAALAGFEEYMTALAPEGVKKSRAKAFRLPGLGRKDKEPDFTWVLCDAQVNTLKTSGISLEIFTRD